MLSDLIGMRIDSTKVPHFYKAKLPSGSETGWLKAESIFVLNRWIYFPRPEHANMQVILIPYPRDDMKK
jgi:hypothetical protein